MAPIYHLMNIPSIFLSFSLPFAAPPGTLHELTPHVIVLTPQTTVLTRLRQSVTEYVLYVDDIEGTYVLDLPSSFSFSARIADNEGGVIRVLGVCGVGVAGVVPPVLDCDV